VSGEWADQRLPGVIPVVGLLKMPKHRVAHHYMVQIPDAMTLQHVLGKLKGRVRVFNFSEKRRFISTGTIPGMIKAELEAEGAEIYEDQQYAPEEEAAL